MAASICNAPYAFIGFLDLGREFGLNPRLVLRRARYAAADQRASFFCSDAKPLLIIACLADHGFAASGIVSTMAYGASPRGRHLCSLLPQMILGTVPICSFEAPTPSPQQLSRFAVLARQVVSTRLELYATRQCAENVKGRRSRQRSEQALTVERNLSLRCSTRSARWCWYSIPRAVSCVSIEPAKPFPATVLATLAAAAFLRSFSRRGARDRHPHLV